MRVEVRIVKEGDEDFDRLRDLILGLVGLLRRLDLGQAHAIRVVDGPEG